MILQIKNLFLLGIYFSKFNDKNSIEFYRFPDCDYTVLEILFFNYLITIEFLNIIDFIKLRKKNNEEN